MVSFQFQGAVPRSTFIKLMDSRIYKKGKELQWRHIVRIYVYPENRQQKIENTPIERTLEYKVAIGKIYRVHSNHREVFRVHTQLPQRGSLEYIVNIGRIYRVHGYLREVFRVHSYHREDLQSTQLPQGGSLQYIVTRGRSLEYIVTLGRSLEYIAIIGRSIEYIVTLGRIYTVHSNRKEDLQSTQLPQGGSIQYIVTIRKIYRVHSYHRNRISDY